MQDTAAQQARRKTQLTAEIERLKNEMTGLEDAAIHVLRVRQAKNAEAEAEAALDDAERTVELAPRQGMVVPKGIVHRTRAAVRTVVLMVEPATVKPTGD